MSLMNYGFTKSKVARLDEDGSDAKREEIEKTGKIKVKPSSKTSTKSPLKSNNKVKEAASKSPAKQESQKGTPKKSAPQKSLNAKLPKETKSSSSENFNTPKNSMQTPGSSFKLNSTSPKKGPTEVSLPYVRIKMIMKSCPEVDMVPHESLHVITKATELFIQHLATESVKPSNQSAILDYESLSTQVHKVDNLEFLKETIPKKITWEQCQKIMADRKANSSNEFI